MGLDQADHLLKERLESFARRDADFWTFRNRGSRSRMLFQYPATMVAPVQATIMQAIVSAAGDLQTVVDPFVGAGTVMAETMRLGMDFFGQDINPLALLICQVRAGPYDAHKLRTAIDATTRRIRADTRGEVEDRFAAQSKWFSPEASVALTVIRRAIRAQKARWIRRFLWVALAETIRLTSNARTSTFKLHIRSADEIKQRTVDVRETFGRIMEENFLRLMAARTDLDERGFLCAGRYSKRTVLSLANSLAGLPSQRKNGYGFDLLVTSPPYGDNVSTVTYGQHSYLPLQWIDLADISRRASPDCLATTQAIDRNSLGGDWSRGSGCPSELCGISSNWEALIEHLSSQPPDRLRRVVSFSRDILHAVEVSITCLRDKGYMVWTLGNRHVGGREVPLDELVQHTLEKAGCTRIARLSRRIPAKRMATRNNVSPTIRGESILVYRKGSAVR